jgi:nucleotide-binding universal stress UspA family protein
MGVGGSGLLLVLGEAPADRRAVAYVARLLGRRRGFRVYIVYVLPEYPSNLLEHGGAGDPEVEERLSAALRAHRRAWVVERRKAALPLIDWASTRLRNAGLPARALGKRFCGPVSEVGAADEILRLARANHCQTIVVARRTRSWLGSLFGGDLRTQLARRTSRVAIWGIG